MKKIFKKMFSKIFGVYAIYNKYKTLELSIKIDLENKFIDYQNSGDPQLLIDLRKLVVYTNFHNINGDTEEIKEKILKIYDNTIKKG